MLRNQIWTNLTNSKFKCIYIGYLISRFKKKSFGINIFLTVISLSSISAWSIWDFLPGLFGIIIATSNIIMVIKPLLAYDKRIKELTEKLVMLEDVQFEYEKLWYYFENNYLKEEDASKRFFELYEKQKNSLRTSSEVILDENKKIIEKSNIETDNYLKNNYSYNF